MDLAGYTDFQRRFLDRLHDAAGIARELGFSALISAAGELERRVLSERFSIAVLGEIKRGKSTLINALLGADVLPRAALVCTAALCLIRYAEKPAAAIFNRDGGRTEVDPLTLKQWVTRKNAAAPNIDRVEIGWPLPLLRDGVVIIDTPGVNDTDEVRRRLTEEFIPRADGVVFVLNAGQPLSDSEVRFLANGVLKHHIKKCWFVVNGLDRIPDLAQREEALEYCRKNLAEIHPAVRLWGVAAKPALEARLRNDSEAWRSSGVADLLGGLSVDLVESRRDALFDVPMSRLAAMLDDLDLGHHWLAIDKEKSVQQIAQMAAEREAEINLLGTERDRIIERFANAVESLVFEQINSDHIYIHQNITASRAMPLIAGEAPKSATSGKTPGMRIDAALRKAVEAILAADSPDETKMADLRQLVRDQVMIETSCIMESLCASAQPIAAGCSHDLSKLLARFDSRIALRAPAAAAPAIVFRTDFSLEKASLGLETRQFLSGFGRLATLAFLLQGNILLAAAAFGTSLASRLTPDLAREVTARIAALIEEGKKAVRQEIFRRRSEIAHAWKQELSSRFDQGLALIREMQTGRRLQHPSQEGKSAFDDIPSKIEKIRAAVAGMNAELVK